MVLNTRQGANGAMRGIFDAVYNGSVYNVLFRHYRFLTAKEVWTVSYWLWKYVFRYLNAAVGIGFLCGTDTLARAAGQVKREH